MEEEKCWESSVQAVRRSTGDVFSTVAVLLHTGVDPSFLRWLCATLVSSNLDKYPQINILEYYSTVFLPDYIGGVFELGLLAHHFAHEFTVFIVKRSNSEYTNQYETNVFTVGGKQDYRRRSYILSFLSSFDALIGLQGGNSKQANNSQIIGPQVCPASSEISAAVSAATAANLYSSSDFTIFLPNDVGIFRTFAKHVATIYSNGNSNTFNESKSDSDVISKFSHPLKCMICLKRLTGNDDAHKHFNETEHVEFENV